MIPWYCLIGILPLLLKWLHACTFITIPQCNWWKLHSLQRTPWAWSYGRWIYYYLCNQCLSPLTLWVRIAIKARCTTLCDKVCQWLATGRWFSPCLPVSSTNKTDRHDRTEILWKVALSTMKQTNQQGVYLFNKVFSYMCLKDGIKDAYLLNKVIYMYNVLQTSLCQENVLIWCHKWSKDYTNYHIWSNISLSAVLSSLI